MLYKKEKRSFSIRKRVLIITISLVASCVIILSMAAIFQFSLVAKRDFKENAVSISNSIEKLIDSNFNNVESSMNYIIDNIDVNNVDSIIDKCKYVDESQENILGIYFYNQDNKSLISTTSENSIYRDGVADSNWFIKTKEAAGRFYVTNLRIDSKTNKSIVTVAKAVMKNQEFKGVLFIDFNLETLKKEVSDISFGSTGFISIFDSEGTILLNSRSESLEDDISKTEKWNEISEGDSGNLSVKLNSEKYRIEFFTVPSLNWKVVLQMPNKEYAESQSDFMKIMIIIAFIALGASVIDSVAFSNRLGKKINKVNTGITKGSKGDFSEDIDIKSNDELGVMAENFNNMQSSISELISVTGISSKDVDESSKTLSEMSEQISKAMNDVAVTITEISKGSMQSAQNLETLLGSLDDISNQIDNINNLSESVGKLAVDTNDLSKKGTDIINVVMDKSNETKLSTSNVTKVVLDLEESVRNIALMNDTISEITEQTNLLALNATIEAARAGEAGKGFAVVAEEIGKLAEQTALSAKNIRSIIENVVSRVDIAVKHVEETSNIVEEEQKSVTDARGIFSNITNQIEVLTNDLKEIVKNVNDVDENKNNIIKEAENISSIVEETAAGTEEVTATAEEVSASTEDVVLHANKLKQLSGSLNKEIEKFKLK